MMLPDDSDALQLQPDPDKLYRYHRQQLSAMLDGELSPDQARFMLRRLEHDAELAGCWERWQVCGDVLRGRHEAPLPADFAAGIALAINAGARLPEDAATAPAAPAARRAGLMRWGGGAALAASVAVAALFVGRQMQPPVETELPSRIAATAAAPGTETPLAGETGADTTGMDASTLALASAAALAVAEVPRRGEREARNGTGRSGAPASTRRERQVQVAVAAPARTQPVVPDVPAPLPAIAAVEPALGGDARVARPWPRAAVGTDNPFAAGYGLDTMQVRTYHPFEPQIDARPRPRPTLVWPTPVGSLGAGLPDAGGTPTTPGAE
ncbi:sigma-E factor negative regulatory protein [Luteimonas yindakuii]|uniref:sigma-E factor negative regulatory protein n=1 Tax=Luteimonas yindakuii TaxID=2565782 RepID=UPI001FC9D8C2|nr:sigma-E factor negative regulatory protein [Luteimonas yindakuii]